LYFQLAPSTLHTEGIGFGLLPTPELSNYKGGHRSETARILRKKEQGCTIGLNDQATLGMLPTPRSPTNNGIGYAKYARKGRLEDVIALIMLPTPTTNDSKNATMPDSQKDRDGLTGAFFHLKTGQTSQLNPRFVMEMMGFPPDWTELPFRNGETNPSKPEGMP
jgi:hypothetical protein